VRIQRTTKARSLTTRRGNLSPESRPLLGPAGPLRAGGRGGGGHRPLLRPACRRPSGNPQMVRLRLRVVEIGDISVPPASAARTLWRLSTARCRRTQLGGVRASHGAPANSALGLPAQLPRASAIRPRSITRRRINLRFFASKRSALPLQSDNVQRMVCVTCCRAWARTSCA